MMKRTFLLLSVLLSSISAYSIFNTRGLGEFDPPGDFLAIRPRSQTSLGAWFAGEFASATDGEFRSSNFLIRPDEFRFFFPLPWRFGLLAQVHTRYDLDFDVASDSVYSQDYTLIRNVRSRGGIDELRLGLDKSFFDIAYLGGGYELFFGGALERWDAEIVELEHKTSDSLLYHFRGNGLWGAAGIKLGSFQVRGYYDYPINLKVRTEVQTVRDTADTDSVTYNPPGQFGAIVSYSWRRWSVGAAYLQQLQGDDSSMSFQSGRIIQADASYRFDPLTLICKAGYKSWYTHTSDGSPISDLFTGVGVKIPIESYGFGKVELNAGLRSGGDYFEYHVGLRAGIEFTELWKRRERMWGG